MYKTRQIILFGEKTITIKVKDVLRNMYKTFDLFVEFRMTHLLTI